MTSSQGFATRLSDLLDLEKRKDYDTVIDQINDDFGSDVDRILEKWRLHQTLTKDEKKYLESYSNIYLSIVKHCLFYVNIQPGISELISKLRERLFQCTQIVTLGTTINFIRNQQPNDTRRIDENDPIFIDLMKLIDARSLTYRLIKDIDRINADLDDALNDCLLHAISKSYLHKVKKTEQTDPNRSITYQHQFFLGCCTFGVALFQGNKEKFKNERKYDEHVCLLVKYVRIMLERTDFVENSAIHYCLRGIFALLTNSIPHQYWLDIMNHGLADGADKNAQEKNPFNLDLFSKIFHKLLAPNALQKKTQDATLNDETLLIDSTMVFLVKWADTQRDLDDNDKANPTTDRSPSTNQLLHQIQLDPSFRNINQILIPYINAKYDRLRLMTLSILSILISNEDFENLQSKEAEMSKNLIELLLSFVDRAAEQQDRSYKGISLDTLLYYLYRFLIQDFIKRETPPHLSRIIKYARSHHEYALKILRRITLARDLQKVLREHQDLKQFLDVDANHLFTKNSIGYSIIEDIRQNLIPPPPAPPKAADKPSGLSSNQRQVFISYSHKDKPTAHEVYRKLDETKLFTKIWIDKNDMRGNAYHTVAKAISASTVLIVLLSDNYCNSDFCGLEWEYATNEKVKVHVIIVQEGFDKKKYDWVRFITGANTYYKYHKEEEMQRFFTDLDEFVQQMHSNQIQKTTVSTSVTSERKPDVRVNNHGYLQKSSIQRWTTDDVQDWCDDHRLERWCRPLKHFDGETVIKLRRDLSNDGRIQLIGEQHHLDLFEITRFKSEVDKVVFPPTLKRKPPTKKALRTRHPSKTSNT